MSKAYVEIRQQPAAPLRRTAPVAMRIGKALTSPSPHKRIVRLQVPQMADVFRHLLSRQEPAALKRSATLRIWDQRGARL